MLAALHFISYARPIRMVTRLGKASGAKIIVKLLIKSKIVEQNVAKMSQK